MGFRLGVSERWFVVALSDSVVAMFIGKQTTSRASRAAYIWGSTKPYESLDSKYCFFTEIIFPDAPLATVCVLLVNTCTRCETFYACFIQCLLQFRL